MAVDLNGYITVPERRPVQPAFRHVVTHVVNALSRDFAGLIHSLYVYSSVAEGRGRIGASDLDITVIYWTEPDPVTSARLSAARRGLERRHSVVSKIDFDCGLLRQVLHPDNIFSWGYWLRHHCVCVYGEDLSQRFAPFNRQKPSLSP